MYCTYTPLSSVTAPPTFSDSSASAATFSELMTFEVKLSTQCAVIVTVYRVVAGGAEPALLAARGG